MRLSRNVLMIVFCCLLGATGCNLIYKQNVQQGNAIEQEKLDQLRIGMTMSQVAYLLGTPAIRDPFHQSRWDYLYSYARRGGKATIRRVTLRFENAVLQEMTGTDPEAPERTITAEDQPIPAPEPAEEGPEITALPAPTELQAAEEVVPTQAETETPAEAIAEQPDTAPAETAEPTERVKLDMNTEHADVRTAETEPTKWLIQIGAFDDLQNARNLVNRLNNAGFSMAIFSQRVGNLGTRYLVRSAGFANKADAERQLQQIEQAFDLDGFLVPPSG
jgi:outer membrane protein assembly factor BamE (lipoprotein component of BamABCDE complex)